MKSELCCRVDGRYLITRKDQAFVLHELRTGNEEFAVVLALYIDPLELVSDLINHSLRRNKVKNVAALIEETKRLAMQCTSFAIGE
ncbi:DUF5405 family protein [Serratia proteamaculans]|uniref:DUF5405 family protein n=1 Tax=Serratia proteamaculans TaxID=28151 RepID=UPI003703F584